MQQKKVLITDDVHQILLEGLAAAGYECNYQPNINLDEVRQQIGAYEGLIINSKILVNKTLLDAAKNLKFVARLGSGMEIIDKKYAAQLGVSVYNSPEGNRNAVAEHAVGMLLALANHLVRADREVRNFSWQREKNRGFELRGKTIGIVGFGHTGSSFAKKLSGWETKILAYDKYLSDGYAANFSNVEEVAPEQIQSEADIISFHLPLTDETRHLGDKNYFEKCKDGVVIINTSRGQVLNTEDLLAALRNKKIGGACLDVFENERTATFSEQEKRLYAELYSLENVVFSPHIAGWTVESKRALSEVLLQKILTN